MQTLKCAENGRSQFVVLSDCVCRIQKRRIWAKIFLPLVPERKTGDFRQGENGLACVIAEMTTEPLIVRF